MRTLRLVSASTLAAIASLSLTACERTAEQAAAPAADQGSADGTYRVPRTSWGDPDLQGKWPGTRWSACRCNATKKLGTRNVLTDEEFTAREAQFARQARARQRRLRSRELLQARRAATSAARSRLRRIGSSAASRSGKRR